MILPCRYNKQHVVDMDLSKYFDMLKRIVLENLPSLKFEPLINLISIIPSKY